jgi:hypothetical protein
MVVTGDFDFPQEFLDSIFYNGNFPWYLTEESTSAMFPFMGHSVIDRGDPEIKSWAWQIVEPALRKFVESYGVEISAVIRCNFNLTFAQPSHESTDMHVDNGSDHKVLIAYLNDCSGDTIIYEKTYDGENPTILHSDAKTEDYEELRRVTPKKNTAVCFDGRHYHAAGFPNLGESRAVCVINFI